MADLPIPFTGPMVRALLREIEQPGTGKTQTRRALKFQPTMGQAPIRRLIRPFDAAPFYEWQWRSKFGANVGPVDLRYKPGDRLYVREHWRTSGSLDSIAPRDLPRTAAVLYNADGDRPIWAGKHRQGMHMPKWASRITLIVTDVRVERLQEISEADAIAEGAPLNPDHRDTTEDGSNPYMVRVNAWTSISPVAWYHQLWDEINGPGAWDANPWVAAYTFRPVLGNIDQIGGQDG